MEDFLSVQSSHSSKRLSKSFTRMDSISKETEGSRAEKMSWRKRYRSSSENVNIMTRPRSDYDVTSQEGTDDKDSWSDDSNSSIRDQTWQRGGKLLFQSPVSNEHTQDYLILNSFSGVEDAVMYMSRKWHLPLPKVILSVISNADYFITPNESTMEELEQGILQSARLTKMWILTDGLNYGPGRIIGEAVAYEKERRRHFNLDQGGKGVNRHDNNLCAIGVVSSDQLRYGNVIEQDTGFVNEAKTIALENLGDDRHELNPLYSHTLIMSCSDAADKEAMNNLKFNLEARLSQFRYITRKERRMSMATKMTDVTVDTHENSRTPVVGVMIQGGPGEIERVLWLLKKQIPVVVINRKGSASGLVASAYKECLRADTNRIEQVYKPQLMTRVKEEFPDYCGDNELLRQQVRDRILEVARIAIQGYKQLLFIVEPNSPDEDLRDLNKFILTAILSAQTGNNETLTRENINWMIRLTLHWNRVDFVTKNILNTNSISRFRVRDDLFVESMLLEDREPFVELFLNLGFLLQRLMTYEQVLRLFEASLSEEFFVTICLRNILHKKRVELGSKFMHEKDCELNRLLCALSGLNGLVDPSFLLVTSNKTSSNVFERRALMTILYWAVLTNRKGLVKALWKRSVEPIAVALVISNMYYRMSKYWIKDIDLKVEIKQTAIEFGSLAIKMMDVVFSDSRLLAFHSLTNPIPEFNNLNVVDLALIGNNIFFIAHPCCQRSMRERWFGNIKIRSYGTSFLNVPEFVKIYLCLLLVFPMYFWLNFKPVRRTYASLLDDDDEREIPNKNVNNATKTHSADYLTPRSLYNDMYSSPNILLKIYYLWTAPITKFWVNQFFVLAYLCLYAIAVMLPYCGDTNINWLLCGWTMVLVMENISTTAQKYQKFPTMDITWPMLSILAEVCTVIVLLLHLIGGFLNFMTYKLMMALSMLAIYFCALRDMLTASPELGPMLVNITELTRKDMINWIRLWMMCLISGGLAINAVIYPAQPFTINSLGRALLRATLGIWLTEIDDLEGDTTCSSLYDTKEISHTCNVSLISPFVLRRLENCPYPSVAGYAMVIQYIMITRLVFYTLMFAMFSATINRTQTRSVELWKYQFQSIVTEFESRPVIPAPLNLITYPVRISYFLGYVAWEFMLEVSACCRVYQTRPDQITLIPYNQWKSYLSQIERQEEAKEDTMTGTIQVLEEANASQQAAIKRLTDHLVYIERHQTMTAVYLEDLKKKLEALDPKIRAHTQLGGAADTHELSRQSPYPGTEILRFPLLDKDVPWDIVNEAYDPATYSKPTSEYPLDEQAFIDIDILSLPMIGGEYQTAIQMTDSEGNFLEPVIRTQEVDILYNAVQTLTLPSGQEVTIDRRSYMSENDQPLNYEVDTSGVPINPMGRTGLRGRGMHPRWGPNHFIKAIISRLKTQTPGSSMQLDSNRPILEILVRISPDGGGMSLIGGPVQPGHSPYSTLCDKLTQVFPDESADHDVNADQEEMIHTFSKFASHIYGKKSKTGYATYGYSAFLVFRGYEDSPTNTDNSWQECEIFNFHYKHKDGFDTRVKEDETVVWQTVSDQMPLVSSELAAVRESFKIRTRTV